MSISTRIRALVLIGVVSVLAVMFGLYRYEHNKRELLEVRLTNMTSQRDALNMTLDKQTQRIHSFAALSQQHVKELQNAESQMDTLRDELRRHTKRLLIRTKSSASMPKANTTRSMGNAATAELSEAAKQDYLRLRELMEKSRQQTIYLQNYIKAQCLDPQRIKAGPLAQPLVLRGFRPAQSR